MTRADLTGVMILAATAIAVVLGVWDLLRRSRHTYTQSVRGIVEAESRPLRRSIDQLRTDVTDLRDDFASHTREEAELFAEIRATARGEETP